MPKRLLDDFLSLQSITLAQTTKCKSCPYESKRKLIEQVLPLDTTLRGRKKATLDDSIVSFMAETIEGWRCDECKVKSDVNTKVLTIERSPEVLLVMLKRFVTYNGIKDTSKIGIPLTLDLNTHRSAANTANTVYDLCSVVKHIGATSNSGHYTCIAKGPDGAWTRFDDAKKPTVVKTNQVTGHNGGVPYLLFYQRRV